MNKLLLAAAAPAFALALTAAPAQAQNLLKQLGANAAQSLLDAAVAKTGVNPYSQGLPSAPTVGSAGADLGSPGAYQRYGEWGFKLNELKVGVDEQWQAVIGVRNMANHRQGMVSSEIKVFLITEDGETIANWGEIYKASVEGSSSGLEPTATLWLEPGDEIRIRLRFANSRGIKPAKIRIQSTGSTAMVRTFAVR